MNRIRWLILILGPLPIVGSSWTLSAWLKPDPQRVDRNEVLRTPAGDSTSHDSLSPDNAEDTNHDGLADACERSARRLALQLGAGCRVIERPPFVLGGDLGPHELELWHAETIEPAVRAMRNCYFRTVPKQPITVLLFRDEQSYNCGSQRLFGDSNISIYGYYKPNQRTLLLNAATGKGTLLHELTHALMDGDFPSAPDWFNEGLASLHEQCRFRSDVAGSWIEGLPNWRLRGLQQRIRQGQLRSLEAMIVDRNFRGRLEGTNYAQARYFCLYMQTQGVLGPVLS